MELLMQDAVRVRCWSLRWNLIDTRMLPLVLVTIMFTIIVFTT